MNHRYSLKKKKSIWVVVSFATIIISVILSGCLNYDVAQIKAIGLLIAGLILWISEAIPMSVATLMLVFMMPASGLMNYDEIISNFGLGTSLFIMASSGITVAIANSNIPDNITAYIFKRSRKYPKTLIFALGITVTIFSGFVSSLATCALFSALVSTALKQANINPEESNVGKDLMLVIPACSGIGGFISPAGTPANLLVIEMLRNNGINISFGKWCLIGLPVSVVTAILFLVSVTKFIRPEEIEIEGTFENCSFHKKDWTIIVTTTIVIIGWFLSGYVDVFNITTVAILGVGILFIPQLDVLDIKQFSEGVNWDLVWAMGSVSVLMIGVSRTGVVAHFAKQIFSGILSYPDLLQLIIISTSICVIRVFVPTTTAVIVLLSPLLIEVANLTAIGFEVLMMIAAFWAATELLLVYTEPIYLITYKEGYYSQADMLKVGILPSVLAAAFCSMMIFYLSNIVL